MIMRHASGWKLLGCKGHMGAFVEAVYYKPSYISDGDTRMLEQFIVSPWQLPVFEELPSGVKSFQEVTFVRPFEEYGYCMRIGDPVEIFNINDTRTESRITGAVKSTRLVAIKDLSDLELTGMSVLHNYLIATPGKAVEFLSKTYGTTFNMSSIVAVVQIETMAGGVDKGNVEQISERGNACMM